MPVSPARRGARILWVLLLTIAVPGLALIFAGLWGAGLLVLLVDEALALGLLWLTRQYAPTADALAGFLALTAVALLLRCGVGWLAVPRMRTRVRPRWYRSTWAAAALVVAVDAGSSLLTPDYGWRSFSVPSGSMSPTLMVGDLFVADVRDPGTRPRLGEVVVFAPEPDGTIYVKRVVGLSGDVVAVRQGHLWVNGQPTRLRSDGIGPDGERRYTETLPNGRAYTMAKLRDDGPMNDTPDYVVPPGNLFVMGDNRDDSMDSRGLGLRGPVPFGFVPLPGVLGPASLRYWPPSRAFTPVE